MKFFEEINRPSSMNGFSHFKDHLIFYFFPFQLFSISGWRSKIRAMLWGKVPYTSWSPVQSFSLKKAEIDDLCSPSQAMVTYGVVSSWKSGRVFKLVQSLPACKPDVYRAAAAQMRLFANSHEGSLWTRCFSEYHSKGKILWRIRRKNSFP